MRPSPRYDNLKIVLATAPDSALCKYPDVSRIFVDRMIGRREELSLLVDLITTASGGQPSVALIAGDAGIGKTRLVNELATTADSDITILTGHCDALGEMVPVSALADIFNQADIDKRNLDDVVESVRDALLRGHNESLSPLGLCEGAMGLVETLTGSGPLVLIVEDLHWADASTRNVFGFIARRLTTQPLLLLATYRTDELHRRHPLVPFLAELERGVALTRIELGPLDRGELVELAEEILGTTPGRDLVKGVEELSGGNPFFAEELLASESKELPGTLREAVLGRIGQLSGGDVNILRLAAPAGARIDPQVMEAVTGLDIDWLRDRLRRLVDHHHLIQTETGLVFRHALAREVLYDELLPDERTRLHAQYAEALTDLAPDRVGEIAHHLYESGDRVVALPAAIAAAEDAVGHGAQAEAFTHLERALSLWGDENTDIEMSHADLAVLAASCAEEIRAYDRAMALVEAELGRSDLKEADLVALAVLLARLRWSANRSDVLEPIESALAEVKPTSEQYVELLIARSMHLNQGGRTEGALESGRRALQAATEFGTARQRETAKVRINTVMAELGDRTALELTRKLLDDARTADNLQKTVLAGVWHCHAADDLGFFDEVLNDSDDLVSAARRCGAYLGLGVIIDFYRLRALERTGRWDDAVERGERLLNELGQFRHHWIDGAMMGLGPIWAKRGMIDPGGLLVRAHREALNGGFIVKPLAKMTPALMERALQEGDFGEVRRLAGEGIEATLPGMPILAAEIVAAAIGAEADRERLAVAGSNYAGTGLPIARDWIDRFDAALTAMVGVPAETAAFEMRARLELARISRSDDPESWSQLADRWHGVGNPYEEAYALHRSGDGWLTGSSPDRERAQRSLNAAWNIAHGLKATPLLDTIESLARHARVNIASSPRARPQPEIQDGRPSLTAREVDVLRLLVEGRSNGQIGKELFITTKTASTHVSNILRKLEAANRVEAATLALRLGLVD